MCFLDTYNTVVHIYQNVNLAKVVDCLLHQLFHQREVCHISWQHEDIGRLATMLFTVISYLVQCIFVSTIYGNFAVQFCKQLGSFSAYARTCSCEGARKRL